MTPTREQFKEFIAAIKKAQEKEENLHKAFELIWDDDQEKYTGLMTKNSISATSMLSMIT